MSGGCNEVKLVAEHRSPLPRILLYGHRLHPTEHLGFRVAHFGRHHVRGLRCGSLAWITREVFYVPADFEWGIIVVRREKKLLD